jgi:hypothetical protein
MKLLNQSYTLATRHTAWRLATCERIKHACHQEISLSEFLGNPLRRQSITYELA